MNNYKIYAHKNKINNKYYIGQTHQKLEQRWKNGEGYKNCSKFYAAIKKYGWNNFEHIILENNLTEFQVDEREKYWIQYYDSINNGYNLVSGGNKNKIFSQDSREKMRQAKLGKYNGQNNPMYGKHHSEETKEKIRQANSKAVVCLNTKQIFKSGKEAAQWAGLKNNTAIFNCCKNKTKTAGIHPITHERLRWQYLEVYQCQD